MQGQYSIQGSMSQSLRCLRSLNASCLYLFNERIKGNNNPLILHRKRNTETDINLWSLPYGTAPGIECLRAYRDPTKPPFLFHYIVYILVFKISIDFKQQTNIKLSAAIIMYNNDK